MLESNRYSHRVSERGTVFIQGTDLPWNLQAVFSWKGTLMYLFLRRHTKAEGQYSTREKPGGTVAQVFPQALKLKGLFGCLQRVARITPFLLGCCYCIARTKKSELVHLLF